MNGHSSASASSHASAGPNGSAVQSAVDRVRSEVERLVESAVSQGERALETVGIKPPPRRGQFPPVDVTDAPETVIVRVDLPGVKPGGVTVDLSGSILTVAGSLPAFPPSPGSAATIAERPHGAFSRSVSLPAAVDPGGVSAELRDGLLTVTLKKNAAAPSHSIPVNAAE
ncbi:Hsp20/alpha crystallin family protein [Alienimonas sp. DA493]|uniref:Hsp20/alpha crystallin family protein n=1 Tax=Alienimonas sp. DA493 TaxID=3373605 RepID=UPI003753FF98